MGSSGITGRGHTEKGPARSDHGMVILEGQVKGVPSGPLGKKKTRMIGWTPDDSAAAAAYGRRLIDAMEGGEESSSRSEKSANSIRGLVLHGYDGTGSQEHQAQLGATKEKTGGPPERQGKDAGQEVAKYAAGTSSLRG